MEQKMSVIIVRPTRGQVNGLTAAKEIALIALDPDGSQFTRPQRMIAR
jgi:hypothetical protein